MIYRFADCVLDTDRRRLTRAGEAQEVEPQVFDLLVLFAGNAGRALGKDEIVDAIWNGRAISDTTLTSRIKAARRAIGDNGREQRLIRTLHRIGYLFEAEVENPVPPAASTPSPATEVRFFRDRTGKRIAYSVTGEGPLVICPAWWVSNVVRDQEYAEVVEFFSRLGRGLTLVRYDRPGVGMSDPDDAERSLADEADLLEDLVAELGAKRYSLFAMSSGGPTAIVHAATHPDRVERICFYGSFIEGARLSPEDVQRALVGAVRAHWGMGSRALADIFLPEADRASLDAFARQQRTTAKAEAAARLLELTYRMDARDWIGDVRAPALVIHRKTERCVPTEAARDLAASLRNARMTLLDGSAHPPWVDGAEIADMANAFLRGGG